MASLPSPKDPSKLIFAPSGSREHAQAEQFTRGTLRLADLDRDSPIRQFHAWFSQAQSAVSADGNSNSNGRPAISHPETCTLATAELPSGRVSARQVYLKELDADGGFVVYTNLGTSRKAADLASNPHAALVFWWEALQRQVRVEGVASRLTPEQSQEYFDTRVRGSRIGAWASRQSEVLKKLALASTSASSASPASSALPVGGAKTGSLASETSGIGQADHNDDDDDGRAVLDARVAETESRFDGVDRIPVPDFWGGLRIVPDRVEFWQGRDSRLHDRFLYMRREGEAVAGKEKDSSWELVRLSP